MKPFAFTFLFLLIIAPARADNDPAAGLFNGEKSPSLHLRFTVEEWRDMQPHHGRFVTPRRPAHQQYPIAWAHLAVDDQVLPFVAARFRGNSSYAAAAPYLKRPLKIDFNYFDDEQRLMGLKELYLSPNCLDPSQVREHLSYELFHKAGIATPRTALAQVFLTIDGQHDAAALGPYTVIEDPQSKSFLKREFGDSSGLLFKPDSYGELRYLGEDWNDYRVGYSCKTDGTVVLRKRFIELTKLISRADDERFAREIESFIDMDQFVRFVAVNVLMANYDSFLATDHNFFVYIHPKTLKAHFFPWDLNLSFGAYVRTGPKVAQFSVDRPWVGSHRLLSRVLSVEKYRTAYREHLDKLSRQLFDPEKLIPMVEKLEARVAKLEKNPEDPAILPGGRLARPPELKQFIRDRYAAVRAQLDGTATVVQIPIFIHGPISGFLRSYR
jgi:spore coat protein CotH